MFFAASAGVAGQDDSGMEQDNHMDHEEDAQSDSDLSSTSAASFDLGKIEAVIKVLQQKQQGLPDGTEEAEKVESNVKSRHVSVPDKACMCCPNLFVFLSTLVSLIYHQGSAILYLVAFVFSRVGVDKLSIQFI